LFLGKLKPALVLHLVHVLTAAHALCPHMAVAQTAVNAHLAEITHHAALLVPPVARLVVVVGAVTAFVAGGAVSDIAAALAAAATLLIGRGARFAIVPGARRRKRALV
jgi:sorbitol-specific phosphotransferase system component IIC